MSGQDGDPSSFKSLFLQNMKAGISGVGGGTVCAIVGHPFDTVKVKMQVFPQKYNSAIDCMKKVAKQEGFRGFYKGITPAMACNVLENGVLFLCYPTCCKVAEKLYKKFNFSYKPQELDEKHQRKNIQLHDAFIKTVGGGFSSFFATFVISPTEMIKCRLQSVMEKKALVVRDILKVDGISGMFRGLGTTMMREIPGYFIIFGGYESTKYLLMDLDMGNLRFVISGGMGGLYYWSLLYPIDLVKSRLQVLIMEGGSPKFFPYIHEIVKKEGTKIKIQPFKTTGFKTLYSGITPTLIRAFVANAALFYTYELFQSLMGNQF